MFLTEWIFEITKIISFNTIYQSKTPIQLVIVISMVLALLCLVPRMAGQYNLENYLWAEDGSIFISQANELGITSIWTPYAGYLHLYPRLIAYFGSFFEIKNQPYIFFLGWFLAYCTLTTVLAAYCRSLGMSVIQISTLVVIICLQPSNGELYFTLTNSQWLLGTALYFLVLKFKSKLPSPFEYLLLTIMCLSGPFSILILPMIFVFDIFERKLSLNAGAYGVLLFCAVIQTAFLFGSDRIAEGSVDQNIGHWFKVFFSMLSFGTNAGIAGVSLFIFWIALICQIACSSKNKSPEAYSRNRTSWFLLASAILNIVAAIYSSKSNPMAIIATGSGNRYSWIPFSLIVAAAVIVSTDFRKFQSAIILPILFVCFQSFHGMYPEILRFSSFANFSTYQRVIIPINPQWPTYPGWSIDTRGFPRDSLTAITPKRVDFNEVTSSGLILRNMKNELAIVSLSKDPFLIFENPIYCPKASDIAVEIDMRKFGDGWLQLFWAESMEFSESNSMRRFYPAGRVTAQFAFPNAAQNVFLRFDPLEQVGWVELEEIRAFCLP